MEIRDKILSEDYAEFFFPSILPSYDIFERYNVEFSQPISSRYSTIFIHMNNFSIDNYNYGMMPKLYGIMDTSPLDASGITRLANQPVLGLRGQGVIIGIIDTGIDYTNPAFKDANGNTRILRIWDQTSNEGNLPRDIQDGIPIMYGSEYTEEQINEAIRSDDPYSIVGQRDEIGHGTFIAGVAGGTPNLENSFSGAATEAKFIVVKLKQAKKYIRNYLFVPEDAPAYQENDIVLAANYIRAYSSIFNMPVSLIIALGTNQGGHEGKSILSVELSRYQNSIGTAVIVAAGNEGNARHHYSGSVIDTLEPDEVEIRVDENNRGFAMEIWVDSPQVFSVGMISPTGEVVERIPARIGANQYINFVFESTMVYVEYELVDPVTGDELIFIRFRNPAPGIWRLRVYGGNINSGVFNCWLPITRFIGTETYFLEPDPYITITDPGMAEDVITVAGYNSYNGAYYSESGRGFSRTGRIKPDITAPSVNITGPTLMGGFENRTATSYGAAITAGACAQFLTWALVEGNMVWMSSAEVRSYIVRGAVRDSTRMYPDRQWGYGVLDIYNAFEIMRNS